MKAIAPPPAWPSDPDHREAIDTLLLMAEAEHRWGSPGRACHLLDNVEQIVGALPRPYERIRRQYRAGSQLRSLAPATPPAPPSTPPVRPSPPPLL